MNNPTKPKIQVVQRRIPNRTALYILMLLALLAWAAVLLYTRFVPPDNVLSFVTFFVLFGVALTCTLSPLAYFIGRRFVPLRLYRPTVRKALRQSALLSLWVVFNLLLRALHSWSIFTMIISLGIVGVVEFLLLARN
ncbi:MAG TPA: hypothetical protein VFA41_11375 [Ktedonobacteraceae bacterium]|jgi:hypothetical protein|nr:hypothetical protein [Ktedonobacteraceae bacterium]